MLACVVIIYIYPSVSTLGMCALCCIHVILYEVCSLSSLYGLLSTYYVCSALLSSVDMASTHRKLIVQGGADNNYENGCNRNNGSVLKSCI